jgi:hypothetical protein
MELTDKEIMDAMPKQLHEDLAEVCRLAQESFGKAKVAGMFRVCLNRGIVDHCRAAIAADRAARHELPPNYVGAGVTRKCLFEHTGKDRKLLEAFYLACLAEGGTTDEITLRGIRAAIAAHEAARPQPVPGWQPIDTAPQDGTEILASDYDAIEIVNRRQRAEEAERLCTEAGIDLKSPDAQRLVRDARDGMPLHDVHDLIKHWNATITTEPTTDD